MNKLRMLFCTILLLFGFSTSAVAEVPVLQCHDGVNYNNPKAIVFENYPINGEAKDMTCVETDRTIDNLTSSTGESLSISSSAGGSFAYWVCTGGGCWLIWIPCSVSPGTC